MMNDLSIPENREQLKKQQIADSIITDLEGFRSEAEKAYDEFSTQNRKIIKSLQIDNLNLYDLLTTWEEILEPLLNALHKKLSEVAFKKDITEHLSLKEEEIQLKINGIIQEREAEVIDNFAMQFYPNNSAKKQRERLKKLLLNSESNLKSIKNNYINYLSYKAAAEKHNVTVFDLHSSMHKRMRAKKHIRHERKDALRSENKRLQYIDNRIELLSALNNGLLIDINDKKLDLITVLDLRHNYEKQISNLTKKDDKSAIKRLAIFDNITSDFKKSQTEKIIIDSEQSNLEATRIITKDIDDLLLKIFDLSNIQKNQLVISSKEYRELIQEKTSILNKRNQK